MDYLTGKQLSEKWGIGQCRIIRLAREGRIAGAKKYGKSWLFPENAEKPADGRTKAAKAESGEAKEGYFRFPLYVNGEENSFAPPLSGEENALRQAQLDFLACDFGEAEKKLIKLSENAENSHVRTMAYFWLCWLSAVNQSSGYYDGYFMRLQQALSKDFPHKREMALLRPWLYIIFVQYEKAAACLDFDTNYEYSPSVLPLMSYLVCADKNSLELAGTFAVRANLYEITVRQLTACGNIFEAQLLHIALFVFYYVKADEKSARNHLKSAVEIAYQYHFIYSVADAYPYYKSVFHAVLGDYPPEFADTIKQCGLRIYQAFSAFSKKNHGSDFFYLLSDSDIKYVLYAAQGYSYRQVADIIHVSERTVANRYAEIYGKLGVKNKQGLSELLNGVQKKEDN